MQMIQHFLKQKWTFPGNSKTDISHLDTQVVHWCPASNQLGLVGCLQTTNHPQTLHQGSGKPFSQANILHNSTLGLIWHLNWHWLCYVVWGQRLCLAQCENVLHTILHDHLWVRLNAAVQTPLCMFLNLTAKRLDSNLPFRLDILMMLLCDSNSELDLNICFLLNLILNVGH